MVILVQKNNEFTLLIVSTVVRKNVFMCYGALMSLWQYVKYLYRTKTILMRAVSHITQL